MCFKLFKCIGNTNDTKRKDIGQLSKTSLDVQQSDVTKNASKRKDIYSVFMFYHVCIAMIFMNKL